MHPPQGHHQPPGRSPQPRAAGSFSPLPGSSAASISASSANAAFRKPSAPARPPPLRLDSSGSEASAGPMPPIAVGKTRDRTGSPVTPIFNQFATAHSNASRSSPHQNHQNHQNFSRPGGARVATHGSTSPLLRGSSRKQSSTQGLFEPSLPSASHSNLSQISVHNSSHNAAPAVGSLSASQIAAQAAVMSHQTAHTRQRSQTVPFPGESNEGSRRGSGSKGPASPPMLSLTEASTPRDPGFGSIHTSTQQDRLGSHSSAATAAANVVFPRSGHNSPRQPSVSPHPIPDPPAPVPLEKPQSRSDKAKAKAKLFSRPNKIGTSKGESKEKSMPSPSKIGSALSALQRANFSTSSLVEGGAPPSLYSLNNSSSATIRPVDSVFDDKGKEKEKRHHFLSRQKQKLKDEYHLPLSSAASNSRPTDPNAPTSLYSFNLPGSPGPSSTGFPKGKKDKKNAERSDSRMDNESVFGIQDPSLPSLSQQSTLYDSVDASRMGMQNIASPDDAWPYLKSNLLVVFEGDDLRLPIEDFNRIVQMHIQWCIHKRSPNAMLEDLRDLLTTGFSSIDRTLRQTPEDRFITTLVELWLFTYTSILPYMQSVFLPLDLEVAGLGALLTPEQAQDFWGGIIASPSTADRPARVTPAATLLDVRRLVLSAYRDTVILPRYDTLKTIFSRLSLEFLPSSFASMALASPIPEPTMSTSPPDYSSFMARPGTAMSLDPSVGSYNSTSTTLLGEGSERGRSRAVSNVSFGSHGSDGGAQQFVSTNPQTLSSVREQNVEDSKQVTDMVGRMLQCMSVLSGLGGVGDADDDGNRRVAELCKMLKLNWLGRGRTGRNRRGIVGGRVRRDDTREEIRAA